jgi:hypothetical protein
MMNPFKSAVGGGLWAVFALLAEAGAQASTVYVAFDGGYAAYDNATGTRLGVYSTSFDDPRGMVFDAEGNLYVVNNDSGIINRVTPQGAISTYASLSSMNSPTGLAIDGLGNLYVANSFSGTINKITTAGVISTFASFGIDNHPVDLAFDPQGNLISANYSAVTNSTAPADNLATINKITASGVISTLFTSDPFISYEGLALDGLGNIFVTQSGKSNSASPGRTITKITPEGTASSFVPVSYGFYGNLKFDESGTLFGYNGQLQKMTLDGQVSTFNGPPNGVQVTGFAVSNVPEPSACVLVGLGVLGLSAHRQRGR